MRVSPEQLEWADIIFVMEKSQRIKLAKTVSETSQWQTRGVFRYSGQV